MKVCSKCGEKKELSEFSERDVSKDGYRNQCKECVSQTRRDRYVRNKDKELEQHRIYTKLNKERNATRDKKHYNKKSKEYSNILSNIFNCELDDINMTYIIKSDGFYKIGRTANLYNRIRGLKPYMQIDSIYVLNKNIESELFDSLSKYRFFHDIKFRGHSECFRLDDDTFKYIIDTNKFKEFTIK